MIYNSIASCDRLLGKTNYIGGGGVLIVMHGCSGAHPYNAGKERVGFSPRSIGGGEGGREGVLICCLP